uniref:Uncharacterized protein n=1 Tax=Ascaris lumbricoides TaxID=6252 RepID=A0A0M3I2C8_ASCLU
MGFHDNKFAQRSAVPTLSSSTSFNAHVKLSPHLCVLLAVGKSVWCKFDHLSEQRTPRSATRERTASVRHEFNLIDTQTDVQQVLENDSVTMHFCEANLLMATKWQRNERNVTGIMHVRKKATFEFWSNFS